MGSFPHWTSLIWYTKIYMNLKEADLNRFCREFAALGIVPLGAYRHF